MARRYRWVLAIGAVLLVATAVPAAACSCATGDPRTRLKKADAAIVGTLVSKAPDGQYDAVYTFTVDEAVKGEFGDTVEVESAADGAACGLEVRPGQQTGLFLSGNHQAGWTSSLCAQIAPDDLREAAAPMPEPDGEGPVKLLVSGRWGDVGIVSLDSEGRTLAYGNRRGGSGSLAVCPGSARFLEVPRWGDPRYAVRETSSLKVTGNIHLPKRPTHTWCRADDASVVYFTSIRYGEPRSKSRLFRYRNGTAKLLHEGSASDVSLFGEQAFMTTGRFGQNIKVLDLDSGEMTFLARVPRYAHAPELSPNGTKLVTTTGGEREKLVLIDIARSRITVDTKDLGIGQSGRAYWLSDDTIVYLPGGYDNSKVKLFDSRLGLKDRLEGSWYTLDEAIVGGTAYGLGWGTLYRAPLPEGPAEVLREFPSPELYSVEAVVDEIHPEGP